MGTRKRTVTRNRVSSTAKAVRTRDYTPKPKKTEIWTESRLIPTGSTMLNLACSDRWEGGFPIGRITTLPGASSAGKTFLTLTSLACCCQQERFDEHMLIYDDVEARCDFDISKLFGRTLKSRMEEPPLGHSDTVQNMQHNLTNLLAGNKPFLYVLDSFDSLSSDEELEKELRKALAAAKSDEAAVKIAGSFGAEKAKIASQVLRMIKRGLSETNSALIIVQQLRQNIGAGTFGKKHTTSGGEAPFFYSHVRPLLKRIKTHKTKDTKVGVRTQADIEKNSLTGKLRTIEFDIFYDHPGLDDIGSMVDFLVDKKRWKKVGKSIKASDLELEMPRATLLRVIEKNGL